MLLEGSCSCKLCWRREWTIPQWRSLTEATRFEIFGIGFDVLDAFQISKTATVPWELGTKLSKFCRYRSGRTIRVQAIDDRPQSAQVLVICCSRYHIDVRWLATSTSIKQSELSEIPWLAWSEESKPVDRMPWTAGTTEADAIASSTLRRCSSSGPPCSCQLPIYRKYREAESTNLCDMKSATTVDI